MLVNTNDAFSGIAAEWIGNLGVGEYMDFYPPAYDAGTEMNSETGATVPGPVAGGEGYNPAMNDKGFVTIHPGVVTRDDGLGTSILNESHRFDYPIMKIRVIRTG